jgi:hypothetical protein
VTALPSSECTVECVAERGGPVTLLCVDADGVRPWLEVAVRTVPAYQRATVAVCAAVVGVLAVVARPIVASCPWWVHAGLGVLVTVGAWLLVGLVADLVFLRLVESLVADTAQAVLGAPDQCGCWDTSATQEQRTNHTESVQQPPEQAGHGTTTREQR